jgi:nicotinamidase-related amidase
MKLIHEIPVFSSLTELLSPKHTALLMVDLQNDFCTPGGHFHKYGRDVTLIGEMLPRAQAFLSEARRLGIFIIHLQQTTLREGRSDSAAWLYLKTRDGKDPDYTLEHTWGHEFVGGLEPLEGEPVVQKHRSSGFVRTTLPAVLAARRIETVVCAGVTTQGCVESTARDAVFFDYHPVVVADCVASTRRDLHDASLLVQSARHEVLRAKEVLAMWTRA